MSKRFAGACRIDGFGFSHLVMSLAWHEKPECNCSRDLQQQKLELPDFGFANFAMHALDIRNLNMIVPEFAAAEACIVQFVMSLAWRT